MHRMIESEGIDSPQRMLQMVEIQQQKSGYAIDSYFYKSPITFDRELDSILFKSWIYAGHESQIPEIGDYIQLKLGNDAIILCRDEAGTVQALFNICRHRGSRVCQQQSGSLKTFVCPYHGWVYNLDGSLRLAREMDALETFNPDDHGLRKPGMIIFHGLIFINCNPETASFAPDLDIIEPAIRGYDLARAKVIESQTYKVNANWKLALENYLECYHCATAHRAYARLHSLKDPREKVKALNTEMLARTEQVTGLKGLTTENYHAYSAASHHGGGVDHSRYALFDGFSTGSRDGQPVAPLMGSFRGYDGGAADFQLGPLCFMLNYPDHCVLYRFIPRKINETDMEVVWFVRADAVEGTDYIKNEVTWLWDKTTREDQYIIMRNSEGVHSRFFEPGPYHPEHEWLCMRFVEWYLDTLANDDI